MLVCLLTFIAVFSALPCSAAPPERYYQEQWCAEQGGIIEYRLPDKSRVDCLTATHAAEVEFAPKWKEAIGQSLYYATIAGVRPGIVLIMRTPKDAKYFFRALLLCLIYGIDLWIIEAE